MKCVFAILFLAFPGLWTAAFVQPGDEEEPWQQLFNGKNLEVWVHVGEGYMTVEDGLIRAHGGMGLLYRKGAMFGNCTLRVVFRMEKENSNSGGPGKEI